MYKQYLRAHSLGVFVCTLRSKNNGVPPRTILWPELIHHKARLDKNMNTTTAHCGQVLVTQSGASGPAQRKPATNLRHTEKLKLITQLKETN